MTSLRDYLRQTYGGFADRRYKDPAKDKLIRVDDHDETDVYPYFCSIFVSVPDREGDSLILTLSNAPCNEDIKGLVTGHGGTVVPSPGAPTITLALTVQQVSVIEELSQAIGGLVGPRRRYSDPNWCWICPRTAESLDRLLASLMAYNALRSCERRSQSRPPESQAQSPLLAR